MLEQMLDQRVRPDARTYMLLLEMAVGPAQAASDAAGLLRAADGLRDAHMVAAKHKDLAQPRGGLSADLVSETVAGMANLGNEALAVELLRDLKCAKGLPVDRRRLTRSTCKALMAPAGLMSNK